MSRDKFWIAYEYDPKDNDGDRVYRYNKGLMKRKDTDGTWFKEPGQ